MTIKRRLNLKSRKRPSEGSTNIAVRGVLNLFDFLPCYELKKVPFSIVVWVLIPLVSLLGSFFSLAYGQLKVVHLKCEYLTNPLGIDIRNPRFFWQLESELRGQRQTAYRILVATSAENLENHIGDAFDSHKINSDQNTHVVYQGKSLNPASTYYWKVMAWDPEGRASAWSAAAFFGTGLPGPADWHGAQWIAWRAQEDWEQEWWQKKAVEMECLEFGLPSWFGQRFTLWEFYYFHHDRPYDPAPLFRKDFKVDKKIKRARIFISGLGYYELSINGHRIGDQVLNPGWTNYKKTVLYDVHDVAEFLQPGENALGVMLGRGHYGSMAVDHWDFYKKGGYIGQPKLICRLRIEYEDGSEENVLSDRSWKVTGGPVIFDDPRMGEIYDARREIKSWDETGLTVAEWQPVNRAPAPGGELRAQLCQPIRVQKACKPLQLEKRANGYWIDTGTQMAGWLRLKLRGPAGEKVLVFYGEKPEAKTLNQSSQFQQMAYILKGGETEIAECRFSYKGFRYALITGYSGTLSLDDIDVCAVNSAVPMVGAFACSDSTINAIHKISEKALISNLHSIPTDCPHREKNGWLGDAVTGMEFGMANYDLAALMTKFTRDIFDTQDPDGRLSIIAPDNNYCKGLSPLWSSAAVHVPWYMWMYYGDKRLFEQYWSQIKRWVQSVWTYNQIAEKPGLFKDVLSDWNSPDGNNSVEGGEVYSAMNFYLVLKRLEMMARILGKNADGDDFSRQAEKVKKAVNAYCFDSEQAQFHGLIPTGYRQGPNAMALLYGIALPEHREKILADLIASLEKIHDYHIYGGIFTVHALYELLPQLGKSELAYRLAVNDSYPGFGYMVKNGATTLWESWQGDASLIHHFFGSIDNFFYRYLAGIQLDRSAVGFRNILITPNFIDALDSASASYHSIHGPILSAWKKSNAGYSLAVKIPANCRAEIRLPANVAELKMNDRNLLFQGKPIKQSKIIRDKKYLKILIPSGTFGLLIKFVPE